MLRSAAIAVLLISSAALADDVEQRAREELERQLKEMVDIPAARVTIEFDAMEEPNLSLEGAEFMLDGRTLPTPAAGELSSPGRHRVYSGELPEGRHELIARIAYVDTSSIMMSEQAGFKWKVSAAVRFDTRRGLDVTVRTLAERDPNERDVRKQIRVKFDQGVQMVAKVDTSVPPPLEKPKPVAQLPGSEAVDAGTPVTAPLPAPATKPEVEPDHHEGAQRVVTRDVRPAGARKKTPPIVTPAVEREPAPSDVADIASARAQPSPMAQEQDAGTPQAPVAAAEVAQPSTPDPIAPAERDAGTEIAVAATQEDQNSSESLPLVPIGIGLGAVLVVAIGALAFRRRR